MGRRFDMGYKLITAVLLAALLFGCKTIPADVARYEQSLSKSPGFMQVNQSPRIYVDPNIPMKIKEALARVLDLINAEVSDYYRLQLVNSVHAATIIIAIADVSPCWFGRTQPIGCTATTKNRTTGETTNAEIAIRDAIGYSSAGYQYLLAHELFHAMGVRGHVDRQAVDESIMHGVLRVKNLEKFVLPAADRKVLRYLYN